MEHYSGMEMRGQSNRLENSSSRSAGSSSIYPHKFGEGTESSASKRLQACSAKYQIRPANPADQSDCAAIKRLWKNNLPYLNSTICPDRFNWLYRQNPGGATHTWLAVNDRDDAVVGCASVLPREVVICGTPHRAGIAIDFAVDREHRAYGVALQLQRAVSKLVWEHGIELVFAFPNEASRGIFKRVGYREAGRSWRGAQLLRSFAKLRPRLHSVPMAAVAGVGVDLVLRFRNALSMRSEHDGLHCLQLDAPDERWDQFWNKVLPDLWFGGAHNLDYLRWRYQQSPCETHRFFCLLDEVEELLGYLVFAERADVLMVDDVQVLEERYLEPLLDRFWKEMRKMGAVAINVSVVGSAALIESFNQTGFSTRDTEGWAGVLSGPELGIDLSALLEQQDKKWYLANAEVDL